MLDIIKDSRNDPKEEAAYRKSDFLTMLSAQKIVEVFEILLGCKTLPKLLEKGLEMLTSS
ncbi:MAG: hypothetical protein LUC43_09200 [Burkholderiales bacterium]|nr:hypothetical protein [Burkholderiales bacterium]